MASQNYYEQQPQPQYQQQYAPTGPQGQPYQQQPYQQHPYQQYDDSAPPPYQPPQQWVPNYSSDEKQDFEQTFAVQKPKWNDLWAGILFLVFFFAFAGISGYVLHGIATTRVTNGSGIYDGRNTFSLSTNTVVLFAFVLAVSIVVSYAYVSVARAFPKAFIWISGILNIVAGLVTAIYMIARHYYSGGIVFLAFTAFLAFAFVTWIPRIPFSALMLKTSVDVSKKHGHVYLASFAGGLLAAAFAAWWLITFVAIFNRFQPGTDSDPNPLCVSQGGCSTAKVAGLIAFITFTGYWVTEWLKNTVHTTIAGVYGSWYFCSHNYPRRVTRGALKRALTYSFGSISLGSLIVAIINFLRQLCSVARSESAAQGDIFSCIIFTCLSCLISIVQWVAEFINRYAFAYIALYGKAFIPAAKDTWKMIKDRGIDMVINECLIGPVLSIGAMFVAYLCALLSFLYLKGTNPDYNKNGDYTALIVGFSFLVGLQICNVFTTPISSGIDTIFVASAWDPQVLMTNHPDIYHQMVNVYPHVQQAIHA